MIHRSFVRGMLAPVALSAAMLSLVSGACSDEGGDIFPDTGEAGEGGEGSGGKAGAAGTGGRSGRGGTSGKGGTSGVGGASGTSGTSGNGGASGNAGTSGTPGIAGTAGIGGVGAGGEGDGGGSAGDMSEAGAGGEGAVGVFRPERRDFTVERMESLTVAAGFSINQYAGGLGNARMLAVHGDHVYVTRTEQGEVMRLVDTDDNGTADTAAVVAQDLAGVHGIAIVGNVAYLATINEVLAADIDQDGAFVNLHTVISDLPDGGQHPRRTLGIGPDAGLYISVGSTCNACPEPNPEHASILRANLDGSTRAVFANGLRNTIGFGWHPTTGELWGMDHGSDMLGDDVPPDELNQIDQGENYGWPYCFGERLVDPIIGDPPGTTKELFCAGTSPSVLGIQAHSAPIGLAFYSGTSFPEAYRDDAFVALHGSWNRTEAVGYKVVRLRFEAGEAVAFEDFVSGFLIEDGAAYFGRPAGIAVGPDGSLLFSDDINGILYRVAVAP